MSMEPSQPRTHKELRISLSRGFYFQEVDDKGTPMDANPRRLDNDSNLRARRIR